MDGTCWKPKEREEAGQRGAAATTPFQTVQTGVPVEMESGFFVLIIMVFLNIASFASADTGPVLVTDESGMRALAASETRGVIRGTVSSVTAVKSSGSSYDLYIHFEGVENDRVIAVIGFPWMFEPLYGSHLERLVGKTIDVISKAREESGQIVFSAPDSSQLQVVGEASGAWKVTVKAPEGTEKDVSELPAGKRATVQVLIKAGENGNELAQEELGYIYFAGQDGLRTDYTKARFWLRRAANDHEDRPSVLANLLLGRMCENGWGGPRNIEGADNFLTYAKSNGGPALEKQILPEWERVEKEKAEIENADKHMVWEEDAYGNPNRVPLHHESGNYVEDEKQEEAVIVVLISAAAIAALISQDDGSESSGSGAEPVQMRMHYDCHLVYSNGPHTVCGWAYHY